MIHTNCSKCGAELNLHEGYGVCENCGEIVAFDIDEEVVEVTEDAETEEIEKIEEIEEIENVKEIEENGDTDSVEEIAQEEPYVPKMLEFEDAPKQSRAPLIIFIVIGLCIVAVAVGYLISFFVPKENTDAVNETEIPEIVEEIDEPVLVEETDEEIVSVTEPVSEPKPTITEEEKAPTITEVPAISYRIRKSADDSATQIGAFSDLERAKAFANNHAADGYKVFDMYGNLIYQP